MIFDSRTYSVLIVSSSEKFNSSIEKILPEARYYPVIRSTSAASAKRALVGRDYDFVIINAPLADDFGSELAIDITGKGNSVCLVLTPSDVWADVQSKVVSSGIFTMPKPVSTQSVSLALTWMASMRERLRKLEKKSASLEERMQEIRTVNRAKWALIEHAGMNEEEAHRYIEKKAMDSCTSKLSIAENIIKNYA